MALKHDDDGFLIGQTVPDLKRVSKGMDSIRKDVAMIKNYLKMSVEKLNNPPALQNNANSDDSTPPHRETAEPRLRDSHSRFTRDNANNQLQQEIQLRTQNSQVDSTQPPLPPVIEDLQVNLPPVINQQETFNHNSYSDNSQADQAQETQSQFEQYRQWREQDRDANGRFKRRETAEPRLRDSHGRFTSGNRSTNHNGELGSNPQVDNTSPIPLPPVIDDLSREITRIRTERERDASGRFKRRETAEPNVNGSNRRRGAGGLLESNDSKERSFLNNSIDSLGDKISGAIAFGTAGLEEISPDVKAFREVAEPLAQGYKFMFGSKDDKRDKKYFSWFGKIWKTLKKTEANTEEGNRESGGGFLSSIMSIVMGGGLFTAIGAVLSFIFSPIALGIGAAGIAAWGLFTESGNKFFSGLTDSLVSMWQTSVDLMSQKITDVSEYLKTKWDEFVNAANSLFKEYVEKPFDKYVTKPFNEYVADPVKNTAKAGAEIAGIAYDNTIENHAEAVAATSKAIESTVNTTGKVRDKAVGAYNWSKNSLASIIGRGESGTEGYNAYNRGTGLGSVGHKDLQNMTIADIQSAQSLPKSDKNRLMAVGKYQVMPSTLDEGIKKLGIDLSQKFDKDMQDKLYSEWLLDKKRPQISAYIKGKSNDATAAQIAGAQEWRSIADPRTGKTYADKGAKGNKASITSDEFLVAMDASKKKYQENIIKGMGEKEAYRDAVINSMPTATPSSSTSFAVYDSGNLKIKSKEATAGGKAQQGTLDFAKALQDKYGSDIKYFSAFNDAYHKKHSPNSGHTKGLKFDAVLNDPKKAEEMKANIEALALEAGVKVKVLNEYAKLSKKGTAPHLDVGFSSEEEAAKFSKVYAQKQIEKAVARPNLQAQVSLPPLPSMPIMPKPQKIEAMPAITVPLANDSRGQQPSVFIKERIGQDLPDRKLALIATGGLSAP